MKLKDLITGIFGTNQLKLVQGVEGNLLRRRRIGATGFIIAMLGIIPQVLLEVTGKQLLQWKYIWNFFYFLRDLVLLKWGRAFSTYTPVPEIAGLYVFLAGLAIYFLFRRTKFLLTESKEPFRYTFWIKKFSAIADTPGTRYDLKSNDRFNLLHHDLMERLNSRIRRLSLLDLESIKPDAAKLDQNMYDAVQIAQSRLVSHINIEGDYAIREQKDKRWVIHVIPRVRIGALGKPSTLGYSVYYPLERDQELTADRYNQLVERVYSSVATEVYKQIEADIGEKIKLFPTAYLRTIALYNEARDFARSNTIDAYDRAMKLYGDALRYFDIARVRWFTRLMLRIPWVWRFKRNSVHALAKIQTGYAKCLIYRKVVSTLTGRYNNPLFEILPMMEDCLRRLEQINQWIGSAREKRKSSTFITYLTFPKDNWWRNMLRLFIPTERVYEAQKYILSDAYLVAALGHFYLDAIKKSKYYLQKALEVDPNLPNANALYYLAAALVEPDLEDSILLLRKATDLSPDFQIAQYLLASKSEMRFRMQDDLSSARVLSIIKEYDRVLTINPGNIAALAAQGYLWWLLGDLKSSRIKFEEGRELKSFVSETFIGELDYGLARIAAEEGRFNDSYDLYKTAISADPRVGAYSFSAGSFDLNQKDTSDVNPVSSFSLSTGSKINTPYYEYIVPAMVERYRDFRDHVEAFTEQKIKNSPDISETDVKDPVGFILRLRDADNQEEAVDEKGKVDNKDKGKDTGNATTGKTGSPKTDPYDPLSKFIREQLPADCQKFIETFNGFEEVTDETKKAMVKQLNELIRKKDFYEKSRFNKTMLNEEAERLIKQNPKGHQLILLNRLLLELAYPNEIEVQEQVSAGVARVVFSFATNDLGNACMNVYSRIADTTYLIEARNAFETAVELNSENFVASYNLYRVFKWQKNEPAALECIKKVKIQCPSWQEAVILYAQDYLRSLYAEIEKQIGELDVKEVVKDKSVTELEKKRDQLLKDWKRQKMKAIEEVVVGTRLTSHFSCYKMSSLESSLVDNKISDKRIEDLLSRNWIKWSERFDESDVRALKAIATIQSYDKKGVADLNQSKSLCELVIKHFYPDNFELALLLNEADEKLKTCDRVEMQPDQLGSQQVSIEKFYREEIGSTVEYWIKLDPIHDGALRWTRLKGYFDLEKRLQILQDIIERNERSKLTRGDTMYSMRGAVYIELGDEQSEKKAIADFEKAIGINSGILEYYVNLIRLYVKHGKGEKAEKALMDALENIPESAEDMNFWGVIYYDVENYSLALEYFQKAVDRNPNVALYHSNQGITLQRLKLLEEAKVAFNDSLKLEPDSASEWNYLGNVYFELLRFEEAMECYKKALRRNPGVAIFYSNLGSAYGKIGQIQKGEQAYLNARNLEPDNEAHFSYQGNFYYDLHQLEKAAEYYQKAIDKKPNVAHYHSLLGRAYYELSRKEDANGMNNLMKARNAFERAVTIDDKKENDWSYLGNTFFETGDFHKAVECYQKAIEKNEKFARGYSNLGLTYNQLNNWIEAERAFKTAIELDSNVVEYWSNLGNLYKKTTDFKKMRDHYLKAVYKYPKVHEFQAQLGLAFHKLKEWRKAIDAFKEALKCEPNNPADFNYLGNSYLELGDYLKALEQYKKSAELDPNNAATHSNLGHAYMDLDDLTNARKAFEEATKLDPRSALDWNSLGTIHFELGDYPAARDHYIKAIDIDNLLPDTHANLGLAYQKLQDWMNAEKEFKTAIKLNPKNTVYWDDLGQLYSETGEIEKLADHYSEATIQYPNDHDFHFELGLAYQKLHEWKKAEDAIKQALSLEPNNSKDLNYLGNIYFESGNINKAVEEYEKSAAIDPNVAATYSNLGIAYRQLNDLDKAENALKEAIRLDPNSSSDFNQLGNVYLSQNKFNQAEEQYSMAIEKNADVAIYHSNLALSYLHLRELEKSRNEYKIALKLDPNSANGWNYLGNVELGLGNYEEAIRNYKEAIRINPNLPIYHINLGLAYKDVDELELAEAEFEQALKLDEEDPLHWNDLGEVNLALADKKSALENDSNKGKDQIVSVDPALGLIVNEPVGDTKSSDAFIEVLKKPEMGRDRPRSSKVLFELAARYFLGALKKDKDWKPLYEVNLVKACNKIENPQTALQILKEAAVFRPNSSIINDLVSKLTSEVK